MKTILIGTIAAVGIIFCGISQSSTNRISQIDNFNNPPNTFASEKELRRGFWVDEFHEYEADKKRFFVCLASFPSMGVTKDRVMCWYRLPGSERLVRVWDVRLVNAGVIKFDYDAKTTRLSLIAMSNIHIGVGDIPMEGQVLASVVLAYLGTEMDVD
jgi:hypothetical protein